MEQESNPFGVIERLTAQEKYNWFNHLTFYGQMILRAAFYDNATFPKSNDIDLKKTIIDSSITKLDARWYISSPCVTFRNAKTYPGPIFTTIPDLIAPDRFEFLHDDFMLDDKPSIFEHNSVVSDFEVTEDDYITLLKN